MGSVEAAKIIEYKYVEKYSQDNSCVPSLPISKKDEKIFSIWSTATVGHEFNDWVQRKLLYFLTRVFGAIELNLLCY
jgi:hypothetical protein